MSDTEPGTIEVTKRKRSPFRNLSIVWLVPLLALAVTLFIAWQTWSDRGQRIEIHFESAQGIVADESTLRYRDVVVGLVEDVRFSSDLTSIVVSARVAREIADSLPQDAKFWVVRPEVTAAGIQGLNTVLSGVYLEVAFDPVPGAGAQVFKGLEKAPLIEPGESGIRVTLRAADASQMSAGAPISYKGIEVGRIENPTLLDGANGVAVDAFIRAPYDKLVTSATRFWVTSGVSVDVGTRGLTFSVGSVANLLRGGLSFDTVFSGGDIVGDGTVFDIFENEKTARSSVFADTIDNAVEMAVEFDESVAGLVAGSGIMYRGVQVGTVSGITAYVLDQPGSPEVRLRASLSVDPGRIGLDPQASAEEVYTFFGGAVEGGLRAQLAWLSLFSQQLIVDLVTVEDAAPQALVFTDAGVPILPTIASDLPDMGATAEGMLARIDAMPFEELIGQVIATLAAIESFAADDDLREAPGEFVALMADARGIVSSEGAQALPEALRDAVQELTAITEDLRRADAVNQVLTTLGEIETAAGAVTRFGENMGGAAEELELLLSDLRELTQKLEALDIEGFLASAETFVTNADTLIASDGMQALPTSFREALNELRDGIAELREGGLIANANSAVSSVKDAAAAAEEAVQRLPDIASRIERVVAEAERVVASYGGDSAFNRETVESLREVRAAAEALSKLARAIERNPNSLLFGK